MPTITDDLKPTSCSQCTHFRDYPHTTTGPCATTYEGICITQMEPVDKTENCTAFVRKVSL